MLQRFRKTTDFNAGSVLRCAVGPGRSHRDALRPCDIGHSEEYFAELEASVSVSSIDESNFHSKGKELFVIGVSERSYVAAGLATAIAGVVVASPMLAQNQVQLPSVSSANVAMSAFVSDAERAANQTVSDAAVGVRAVRDVVERAAGSAVDGTAAAAAGLKSNPLMQAAAVTVVAKAVNSIAESKSDHAANAAAVSNPAASPSVTAAFPSLPGLPSLGRIIAVPLLLADIPVVLTSEALVTLGADTGGGLGNVLAGLAFGDMDEVQAGFGQIANTFPDFANRVNTDFENLTQRIKDVFGGVEDPAASVMKAIDAKSSVAVGSEKAGNTEAGSTKAVASKTVGSKTAGDAKGGTSSTSASSTGVHENAPSSVNDTAKTGGAAKSENAAHRGLPSGSPTHTDNTATSAGAGSAVSGSATKKASAGDSGTKHTAAAGAKKGGDGAGGSKGGKHGK
jgi:hypothetical protein